MIDFNSTTYDVRDIWAKKTAGTTDKIFTAVVPSHDVIMLWLTKYELKKMKKPKK